MTLPINHKNFTGFQVKPMIEANKPAKVLSEGKFFSVFGTYRTGGTEHLCDCPDVECASLIALALKHYK